MNLSGQQRKQLQEALIDAFPTTVSLEEMLCFELDKNLTAIVKEGSLQNIIFELIKTANSQGWIKDLLDAVRQSNPGNQKLKIIVQELLTGSLAIPSTQYQGVLRSYQDWSGDNQFNEFYFVEDGRLEKVSVQVHRTINQPRGVVRVIGHSGLGKTRLIFEIFRNLEVYSKGKNEPIDLLSTQLEASRARVIVLNAREPNILSTVQWLRQQGKSAILIADDCPVDLHQEIARIVRHSESKLNLISLDYDLAENSGENVIITIERADDNTIRSIIQQKASNLTPIDTRRLIKFTQGYPQLAVLLAQAYPFHAGEIAKLADDILLEKMLVGRSVQNQNLKKIVQICALFNTLGISDDYANELSFVINHFCELSEKEFDDCISKIKVMNIAQERYRLLQIQPLPVAYQLATQWWLNISSRQFEKLKQIIPEMPARLRYAMFEQFAKLDKSDDIVRLAEKILQSISCFTEVDLLKNIINLSCLGKLGEVNPLAVAEVLENFLIELNPRNISEFYEVESELLNILKKLCLREESFLSAAKILVKLSALDRSDCLEKFFHSHNWSYQALKEVFQLPFSLTVDNSLVPEDIREHFDNLNFSGAAADSSTRLVLFNEILHSDEQAQRRVIITLLGDIFDTGRSRSGMPEVQGIGPILRGWLPSTLAEHSKHFSLIIGILADLATGSDIQADFALKTLISRVQELLNPVLRNPDIISSLCIAIFKIQSLKRYIPELIIELECALHELIWLRKAGYNINPAHDSLIIDLLKTSLPSEPKDLVDYWISGRCIEYFFNQYNSIHILSLSERTQLLIYGKILDYYLPDIPSKSEKHRKIIESIAEQCASILNDFQSNFESLFSGNYPNLYLFGFYLAKYAEEESLVNFVLSNLDRIKETCAQICYLFIIGIVDSLNESNPTLSSKLVSSVSDKISLFKAKVDETKKIKFDKVQDLINDLESPKGILSLDTRELICIVDFLLDQSSYSSWLALDILCFYRDRGISLPPQLNCLIYRLVSNLLTMDSEELTYADGKCTRCAFGDSQKEVIKLLWELNPQSQESIATVRFITEQFLSLESSKNDSILSPKRELVKNLFPLVFERYASEAWSIISLVLVSTPRVNDDFISLLASIKGNDINAKLSPILNVPQEELFDWCKQFPNKAPKILIRIPPALENFDEHGSWHPIVKWLLDNFGNQKELLSELERNINTNYSWSGGIDTYYRVYLEPLKNLRNHTVNEVCQWAIAKYKEFKNKIIEEQGRSLEFDFVDIY